jgi:hypothetical protein
MCKRVQLKTRRINHSNVVNDVGIVTHLFHHFGDRFRGSGAK